MLSRAAILIVTLGWVSQLWAQAINSPVYFANPDYIRVNCDIGREIVRQAELTQSELDATNLRIRDQLLAEEERLTELRDTMSIEEFQPLADAFNETAEGERQRLALLSLDAEKNLDAQWFRLVEQIKSEVAKIAQERNGATILDTRSALAVDPRRELDNLIIGRLNASYELNKSAIDALIFAPYDGGVNIPSQSLIGVVESTKEDISDEQ